MQYGHTAKTSEQLSDDMTVRCLMCAVSNELHVLILLINHLIYVAIVVVYYIWLPWHRPLVLYIDVAVLFYFLYI